MNGFDEIGAFAIWRDRTQFVNGCIAESCNVGIGTEARRSGHGAFFKMAAFLRHELPIIGDDGEGLRKIGAGVLGEIDSAGGMCFAIEIAVWHEGRVAET